MNIRRVKDDDIMRITEIYNWYISNTTITFETETISPLEMKKRVQEKVAKHDWLVGEFNQEIVGYAYYGSFRSRPAYNHTVELTIYLAQESIGKGFGKSLYDELIKSAEKHGFRELIGVIALPNLKSTMLHQNLGFEEIGVLKKVGYKFDKYIDVAIWQKSIL
ncbi:GNAT family N-acetyltransferase [Oculatella sp. LEGE 06141]|uniref:GNAT family N-acetyltransferase n=1 Tax=Oculatella sp. LEGE 06141 TaxID=1828648 RepID=UPI001D15801F|nr:GNAT family N-acetyltransferase [Oculatella sp. LEGE 06141]